MAIPYSQYFSQAQKMYAPARERDISESSAALADKGLLASTGGQGALADIRGRYQAMAEQTANDQGRWQAGQDFAARQFAEQKAQNARTTAQQWYDMINSATLAKAQLGMYKDNARAPWANQPTWLGTYMTNRNLRYGDGQGEIYDDEIGDGRGKVMNPPSPKQGHPWWRRYILPIGDAKGDVIKPAGWSVPAHTEDLQATYQEREGDRQYDLDKSRLALAQRQYADAKADAEAEQDPWAMIAEAAYQNATTDIDPEKEGFQAGAFPTQLLNGFRAMYGIDVETAARTENPHQDKALAVMKLLYPKTWMARISGDPQNPMEGPSLSMLDRILGGRKPFGNTSLPAIAGEGVTYRSTGNYTAPAPNRTDVFGEALPTVDDPWTRLRSREG